MKLTVREICVFGMLGAVMYASKILMEAFPNVHLLGVFVVSLTVVYRQKALYPIYVFILLLGLLNGFSLWWMPYLYLWALLWGAVMLVPTRWPARARYVVYVILCGLHGFLYGTLYAPAQALLFRYSLKTTIAWIISGLPWDAVHGVSNLICGSILMLPFIKIFRYMNDRMPGN